VLITLNKYLGFEIHVQPNAPRPLVVVIFLFGRFKPNIYSFLPDHSLGMEKGYFCHQVSPIDLNLT
jgi:hypothetical protein